MDRRSSRLVMLIGLAVIVGTIAIAWVVAR